MRDITALHPRLQEKAAILQEECRKQGIYIKFSECLRTIQEQDELYAQGRTKPGNIVTNAKGVTYSSQHQWGIAIDFCLDMDVNGDGSKANDAFNNSTGLFNRVGDIAKSIGLGWGGDWISIKDTPHLYLPDWGSTTSKLKQLYGTPRSFMLTWGNNTPVKNEESVTQQVVPQENKGVYKMNTLKRGSTGNDVTIFESIMKKMGHYTGAIDTTFGSGCVAACNAFQSLYPECGTNNHPDGIFGSKCWAKVFSLLK